MDSIDLREVKVAKVVLTKQDKLLSSPVVPRISLLLVLNLVLKALDSIRDHLDSLTNKETLVPLDNKDSLAVLRQVVVALNLKVVILVTNTTILRPVSRPQVLLVSTVHNSTKLLSQDLKDLSIGLLVLELLNLQTLLRDLVLRPLIDLNQVYRDHLDPLSDLRGQIRDLSLLLVPPREISAPPVPLRDRSELLVLLKDH